jgi:hypothetical protein
MITGIKSRRSNGRAKYLLVAEEGELRKTARVGWMRKMAGKIAIVAKIDRLRR